MTFTMLLWALLGVATPQPVRVATGSYVAKSLDSRPLPAELRLPTSRGYYRWFRLDNALLRLRPGGNFTVSYTYYEQHLQVGKKPSGAKLYSETQMGAYVIRGSSITLVPVKPKTGRKPPPTTGQITPRGIVLPYDLREGESAKRHSLLLVLDPSYW